jgi:hypothetical protein
MNLPGCLDSTTSKLPQYDIWAVALLLASVGVAFGWRAEHGIWFKTFSDETGHVVGAQAISAGYRLYRDFVDEHGPLIYAVPQLYGALVGWANPNYVRAIPILCMAATSVALGCSPALTNAWGRLLAAALFIGLTGTVWLVQGLFMLNYQPLAGMLIVIGLVQFTVPACYGSKVGRGGLFLSGLAFGLTPFVAFTYGPSSLLFGACGVWAWLQERREESLLSLLLGVGVAVSGTLAWMAMFADFRGYLAYHFIAAMRFYSPYIPPSGAVPSLTTLWPNFSPPYIVQAIGIAAAVVAGAAMFVGVIYRGMSFRRVLPPFVLGCVGVILTNPRGSPIFQNGAFILVAFGLAAITLAALPRLYEPRERLWLLGVAALAIFAAEAAARRAISTPHGLTRALMKTAEDGNLGQSDAPWARKLRLLTDAGEPTLALPFYPDFYLQAGRLPMRGYYIYLPWDADFGRRPVLGLNHDLCHDLAKNPPPVLYYNGWVVWGRYDPRHYLSCVLDVIGQLYKPMPGEADLYIRTDRLARLSANFP